MKTFFYLLIVVAAIAGWIYYPTYKSKLPKNVGDVPVAAKEAVKELWQNLQQTPTDNTKELPRFVSPDPLPKQDNWTWTTTTGNVYFNVKIVKVEADCVTIIHKDGGARIDTSTLPAPIQRQLNYAPALAANAAQQRESEMAYTKQQMDAESAEIKSDELAAAAISNAAPIGNVDADGPIKFQISYWQKIHDDYVAKASAATDGSSQVAADIYRKRADAIQKRIGILQSQLATSSSPPPSPLTTTNAAPQ